MTDELKPDSSTSRPIMKKLAITLDFWQLTHFVNRLTEEGYVGIARSQPDGTALVTLSYRNDQFEELTALVSCIRTEVILDSCNRPLCSICGGLQTYTPSGPICPKGHGGVDPVMGYWEEGRWVPPSHEKGDPGAEGPGVPPLRSRTMTLEELQQATLLLIRRVRKQLAKLPWQSGLTDEEFMDQVLSKLETEILQDIEVLRMKEGRG